MDTTAMNFAAQALYLVLILSLPPIVVASVVGLLFSLVQAITQLQEQTLAFGVKLIAVIATLFMLGGWLSGQILRFSMEIFNKFYMLQ